MDTFQVPSFLPVPVSKQNTLQGNDGKKCESTYEHIYCTSLPETEAPVHQPPLPADASAAAAKRGRVSQEPTWSLVAPEGLSGETRPCSASWPLWGHYVPGSSQKRVIEIHSLIHQVIRVTCFLALQGGFPWVCWPF